MYTGFDDFLTDPITELETKAEDINLLCLLEAKIADNISGYVYQGHRLFVEMYIGQQYRVFEIYRNDPCFWLEYDSLSFSFLVDDGWEAGLWQEINGEKLTNLIVKWRNSPSKEKKHEIRR